MTNTPESNIGQADTDYVLAWKAINATDGSRLAAVSDDGNASAQVLKECFRNAAPKFESGRGVVTIGADMPDCALLAAIRIAARFGAPFSVIPVPKADDFEVATKRDKSRKGLDMLGEEVLQPQSCEIPARRIELTLPRRQPQGIIDRLLSRPIQYFPITLRIDFDLEVVKSKYPVFNIDEWYCDFVLAECEPQYRQVHAFNIHIGEKGVSRYRHEKSVRGSVVTFAISGSPLPIREEQFDRLRKENLQCSVSLVRSADGATLSYTEMRYCEELWDVR